MNNKERFHAITDFKPVDRYINMEGALWDQTLARWIAEGLSKDSIENNRVFIENGILGMCQSRFKKLN